MLVRAKESNLAKIKINSGLRNILICYFVKVEAAIRKAKEDAEKEKWNIFQKLKDLSQPTQLPIIYNQSVWVWMKLCNEIRRTPNFDFAF